MIHKLKILAFGILMAGCAIMPPRRQYISAANRQTIPDEILNTEWTLESFEAKIPDCGLSMKFLDKGRFTIKFGDQVLAGDNLWYLMKDGVIEFHTTPLEKIAWTGDNCEMNPSVFALYLMGDKKVTIVNNTLTFDTFDKRGFEFKKV